MKILGFLLFLLALVPLIGVINPNLLNKGAKKPLSRSIWFFSALIPIALGILLINTGTEREVDNKISENTKEESQTAYDDSLPADPQESEKIKTYGNRLSDIVTNINKEVEKQAESPDQIAWSSFAQNVREEIKNEHQKFNNEFPVVKVSEGNRQNVIDMNDLYITVEGEYIKAAWGVLDGSGDIHTLKQTQDKVISQFKKIQFQQ